MRTVERNRQEKLIVGVSLIAALMVAAVVVGGTMIKRTLLADLVAERGRAHAAALERHLVDFRGLLSGNPSETERQLIAAVLAGADAVDFALLDAEGHVVAAAFPEGATGSRADDDFLAVATGGALVWLEERPGAAVGPEVLGTAYVPYLHHGGFVGALRLDMDITAAARAIERRVTDAECVIVALWILLSGLSTLALVRGRPAAGRWPVRGVGI